MSQLPIGHVSPATQALFYGQREEAAGRLDQSVKHYRDALSVEPKYARARLALAWALTRLSKIREAAQEYEILLESDPNNVTALHGFSWVQCGLEDFSGALATIDRLEALGGDTAHELTKVAFAFMHLCDWSRCDTTLARIRARFALTGCGNSASQIGCDTIQWFG